MSLYLTHRQIIEEIRSQAGLVERRAGHWEGPQEEWDDHQIGQQANDGLVEFTMRQGIRNVDNLPMLTERLTWPDSTEAIHLFGARLDPAHPRLTRDPAVLTDMLDETSGQETAIPVEFAGSMEVRAVLRGSTASLSNRRMVLRGRRLEAHPTYQPSFAFRVDYVPWPERVVAASEALYESLPMGLLRACVTQVAADLAAMLANRAAALAAIAERRRDLAFRFYARSDRLAPRSGNTYRRTSRGF